MLDQRRPEPARYAVFFRAGTSGPTAGALVVDDQRFMLIGGNNDNPIELSVPYSELRDVRIGRSNEERLNGRPALMLVRDDGPVVQVAPFGFGLLHELAEVQRTLEAGDTESPHRHLRAPVAADSDPDPSVGSRGCA